MKGFRKLLVLLLCLVLMISSVPVSFAAASTAVIYVNTAKGNNDNDGLTPETAKKHFSAAVKALNGAGGTIVVSGNVILGSAYTIPAQKSKITITGEYNGTNYNTILRFGNGGEADTTKINLYCTTATEIRNLTLNSGNGPCAEIWSGPSLKIGAGVKVTKFGSTSIGYNDFLIRGGLNTGVCDAVRMTIQSGNFSAVHGGNNKYAVGSSTINFSGSASVSSYLQGGGTNKNVAGSEINISGGTIPILYANGYGTASLGTSVINISGGKVYQIETGRFYNGVAPTGKITESLKLNFSAPQTYITLDLDRYQLINNCDKSLVFDSQSKGVVKADFSKWNTISVKNNSTVYLMQTYRAPTGSLTVESGSTLRLTKDTRIPSYSGGGVVELYEPSGHELEYHGEPYIAAPYLKAEPGSDHSVQGFAVYGQYGYILYDTGVCSVYDLENRNNIPLGTFHLGSYSADNHANQAMFSGDFYGGNTIPLLYVTTGSSSIDEKGNLGKCSVENIKKTAGASGNPEFTSETVQTILYNNTGIENTNWETPGWGAPASFVDSENGWYYLFSARYRTTKEYEQYYDQNAYIITKFKLPEIKQKGETVTLKPSDIVDQFTTEFNIYFTQGGTLYINRIYYTFGAGKAKYPNAIRVFNLETKSIEAEIDLSKSIFSGEEIECCAIYNGSLLCNTNENPIGIYEIPYIQSKPLTDGNGNTYTKCCICDEIMP